MGFEPTFFVPSIEADSELHRILKYDIVLRNYVQIYAYHCVGKIEGFFVYTSKANNIYIPHVKLKEICKVL